MDPDTLRKQIVGIRGAIRYHRAQISDYRCWVDDERLYQLLSDRQDQLPEVPEPEEFARRCNSFWERRQRPHEIGLGDPTVNSEIAPQTPPEFSDCDLESMSYEALLAQITALRAAVRRHMLPGYHARTVADDEQLYLTLPEQVPWSSALPSRSVFLGNCARFCQHCQSNPYSLLEWAVGK